MFFLMVCIGAFVIFVGIICCGGLGWVIEEWGWLIGILVVLFILWVYFTTP